MNPSAQEYLHTYETLKDELSHYKSNQSEMRLQIGKLLDENKRLYGELKDRACRQELQSSESGYEDLQKKFTAAVAAKNAAVEMWQVALLHLEQQELQLMGKQSLVEQERSETGKVIDKVKEEYVKGLNILSNEVTAYRNELSDAVRELRSKTSDLEKCKAELEAALKGEIDSKRKITELRQSKEDIEGMVESLKALLSETESFLNSTKDEMASLKTKNDELSTLVSDLKDQNRSLKSKITTLEKDAKESILTAQEAVLRRKEMSYREEQYLKDIEHLKSAVNIEAEKLSMKHKSEIKNFQRECEEKVKVLMEEIETLHRDIVDRQSLFERACREKQAVESKLELLHSECANNGGGYLSEELCRRLTLAEKRADELEYRSRHLETELREVRLAKEQEVKGAIDDCNEMRDRLAKVVEDFGRSSSDRLQLAEEVTKLKKSSYVLEKELVATKKRSAEEIALLKEDVRQKEEAFTQKMHSDEERYKKAIADLQSLLDAELKISARRSEVLEEVIAQSEAKIKELQQTIIHLKRHNEEMGNGGMRDIYVPNYALTMNG